MTVKTRVDAELVRRGMARSRRHASELVTSGRVIVAGRVVGKPSTTVADGANVSVTPGSVPEFASRGGFKLAGALDALNNKFDGPQVKGAFCADLGASTGGFTDVLLRRGAAHVVAIDVGHDQLITELRTDNRVTVVEGFNVRDLAPTDLAQPPDLVVADLSFISLTMVLPAVAGVLRSGTHALLMVKPQFEVGRERLGSGGVVRDLALHAEAVITVVRAAARVSLRVRAVVPSPLPGPSGNREYFVWLTRSAGSVSIEQSHDQSQAYQWELARAVGAAVAWNPAQGEHTGHSGQLPQPPAVVLPDGQDIQRTGQKEREP